MDVERMQRLIARIERDLTRAWARWIDHVKAANSEASIEQRMHVAAFGQVLHGLEAGAASFAAAEHQAFGLAGQTAAKWLATQVRKRAPYHTGAVPIAKKLLHFDAAEPEAVRWAEQNRLDLIREIDAEQRILIRFALMEGAATGEHPRTTARAIRESIGLTEAQERAVQSYQRSLENGQYSAALRRELSSFASDRTIAAAARAGTELTAGQIEKAVASYRENFIALRAETIARTEASRIAHQATEELYRQAIERGDIEAEQVERTWHHAGGGKKKNERLFHVVMNGQTRGWGELFDTGIGGKLRYPCDPNASAEETVSCHCLLTVRIKLGAAASASGQPGVGGSAEEDVPVTDEAALDAEADAAEEEAGAAEAETAEAELANEEAAAAEEEALAEEQALTGEEPDLLEPIPATPAEELAPAEVGPATTADMLSSLEAEIAEARAAFDDYEAEAGTRLFERLSATAERLSERAATMTTEEQAKLQALNRSVNGLRFRANNEPVRAPAAPEAIRLKEYNELATEYADRLTPDQRYAITNYSNHTDKILNPMLRAGEVVPDADLYSGDGVPGHVHDLRRGKRNALQTTPATVGAEMAELDAAIERASLARDVELYRVMSDPNAAFLGDLEEGSVFSDRGYVSTATNVNYLDDFYQGEADDRVDMFLKLKKGQFAAPLGDLSDFKSEREMLLPRGSRFRVERIEPATPERAKRVYLEML